MRFLFVFLLSAGCASYQFKVSDARRDLEGGQPSAAMEKLKPLAFQSSRDQLVYLMDYGLAAHLAGNYEESNRAFLMAADLAEFQDYHSVSKITGSLLLSEEMVQYKGEAYENLMVQIYLAKNFILLGNLENAMVSVRKINEIMEKFRIDNEVFAGQNVLAHYFSAIVWESQKDYDSAAIEYEKAYKLRPTLEVLAGDLLRANYLAGRTARYNELRKSYPHLDSPETWNNKQLGELIVFFSNGWAPRKRPHPETPRFPHLVPVSSSIRAARVSIEDHEPKESTLIYSIEDVAMNTLAKDYDELVAKRLAAIAAKAVVSDQIRQKNKLLGDLSWIIMNVADRADVRQWSTLPEGIQLLRMPLAAGEYQVVVDGISASGVPMIQKKEMVKIAPGEKQFVIWRTF